MARRLQLPPANMNTNDAPQTIDTNTLETTTGGRHHGHHHHCGWGRDYWAAARAFAYASAVGGYGWGRQPVVINYY